MDIATTPGCVDCQHWRCGNCSVFSTAIDREAKNRSQRFWQCCNCNGVYGSPTLYSSTSTTSRTYSPNPIPRYRGVHLATISISWSLWDFIDTQLDEHSVNDIGSVITLTGSATAAQAISCRAYLNQTWPMAGRMVIETLQAAVQNSGRKAYKIFQDCEISIDCSDHNDKAATVYSQGTYRMNEQVVQILSWIGAAIRTSTSERIEFVEPIITKPNYDPNIYHIDFINYPISEEETLCWMPLFCNAVVARGFRILNRNDELGLEIPIEMMTALGGVKHAIEFKGGLILKGTTVAFVPIKVSGDSISWHCIHNDNGCRLSYPEVASKCTNRAMLEDVNLENFKNKRAILGWWSNVEPRLGAQDVLYENISWSASPEVKRSLNVSEGSFGIQYIAIGELKFSMPPQDNRLRIRRDGIKRFQSVVEWSSQLPVLLYDCDEKRGWLVTASDAILHMAIKKHLFRHDYFFGGPFAAGESFTFADPGNHGFSAGEQALLKNKLLCLDGWDVPEDERYLFKDIVFELWSSIECLLDKNVEQAAIPGKRIQITTQEVLCGWEFMDIVKSVSTLRKREVNISKTNGGWVDLVNDIDAVVLFASGFGDLITPTFPHPGLCHEWRTVPKGKDYMAAGVPILDMLYNRAGCALTRKHITQTRISWHQNPSLFEPCSEKSKQGFSCDCNRLQQLVKDSQIFGQQVKSPGRLSERGAVIFGRDRFVNSASVVEALPTESLYSQPNIQINFSMEEITAQSSGSTLANSLRM